MTIYPQLITDALRQVRYPGNGKNLIEAGMVEDDLRTHGFRQLRVVHQGLDVVPGHRQGCAEHRGDHGRVLQSPVEDPYQGDASV